MSTPTSPYLNLIHWLSANASFPRARLSDPAEKLLLMAAAAQEIEEANSQTGGGAQRRDQAKDSAMRAHAMRRSMVHYRCDNSAKV